MREKTKYTTIKLPWKELDTRPTNVKDLKHVYHCLKKINKRYNNNPIQSSEVTKEDFDYVTEKLLPINRVTKFKPSDNNLRDKVRLFLFLQTQIAMEVSDLDLRSLLDERKMSDELNMSFDLFDSLYHCCVETNNLGYFKTIEGNIEATFYFTTSAATQAILLVGQVINELENKANKQVNHRLPK